MNDANLSDAATRAAERISDISNVDGEIIAAIIREEYAADVRELVEAIDGLLMLIEDSGVPGSSAERNARAVLAKHQNKTP